MSAVSGGEDRRRCWSNSTNSRDGRASSGGMTPCRGRPCPQRGPPILMSRPTPSPSPTSRPATSASATAHPASTPRRRVSSSAPVADAASRRPSRGVAVFVGHDQHAEHRAGVDGFGVGLLQPGVDDGRAGLCRRRGLAFTLGDDQRAAADGEVAGVPVAIVAQRSQSGQPSSTRKRRVSIPPAVPITWVAGHRFCPVAAQAVRCVGEAPQMPER